MSPCITSPAAPSLLHFTPVLSLPCPPWRKGCPHRPATSSRVGGRSHQSITSPHVIPGLSWFVWVLQKPLSSLGTSGPPGHLQSPSSTSRSLQPLHPLTHRCWSCPSCHPIQRRGCGHGARGRWHFEKVCRWFHTLLPTHPLVLSLCEWFHTLDGKTCHPLRAALEVFHISGFPVAQPDAARHPCVPRAWPQWGNCR